jgi:hypothetical protein
MHWPITDQTGDIAPALTTTTRTARSDGRALLGLSVMVVISARGEPASTGGAWAGDRLGRAA